MSKIKGTLLLLIFSITNIFAMRMSPSQIEARKKSVSGIMSKMKKEQTFKKELMDAGWSQDKIRELRQKRNAHGTLVYPVHYSPFQHDTADQKALNDFLIEHYYGKIYAALQTVPVDERSSWTSDFHLLLVIGLDNFKKGGKERFDKGLLKMINSAEDGLELGALGTKYLAFKKVKETTNNFTAIPFIGGTKISPIELFEQIIKPDQQQEMKEIIPHIKIIEKPQLPETLPLSKEDQDKELKEAFDIKEDQINQSMVDLKNVLSQEQALSIIKEELEPGEFFVYQKGTKEGLILSWDDIQKSGVIVNMLGDSDWVTREKLSLGQEKLVFNKDRWQREQSAIPLPCSIDMLEIIFGHSRVEKWDKSSILGELSWEQLENLIRCSDYLMLSSGSDKFNKAVAYWVNTIGMKLLNLVIEMHSDEKRSIKEIENNLPDYKIFGLLTKSKELYHGIILSVLSIKDNFCQKYADFYNNTQGLRDDSGYNKKGAIDSFFNIENGSIMDLLNVVKKLFTYEKIVRERREESKKWFWQRKNWF